MIKQQYKGGSKMFKGLKGVKILAASIAGFVVLSIVSNASVFADSITCPLAVRPEINSGFGPRGSGYHYGIDLGVPEGTPVYASESGNSEALSDPGGYGIWIQLIGTNQSYHYGHLGQVVKTGAVNAGDLIAYSDTTGNAANSDFPHLHWEVHTPPGGYKETAVDPAPFWNSCKPPGGGGGSQSTPAAPIATPTTGGGTTNPSGGDCHSYQLQYDPNNFYPCVKHLQNDLNDAGANPKLSPDGYFGNGTKNAVAVLQGAHGLPQTGVVNPATWCAIHNDLCGGAAPSHPANPAPIQPTSPASNPVAPPTQSSHSPYGVIDASDCGHIAGWAFDADNKGASIRLSISVDGTTPSGNPYGNTNIYRSDVNSVMGVSGNHGFDWGIPAEYKNSQNHTYRVYAVGIDTNGNANNDSPQITAYSSSSNNGGVFACSAPSAPSSGQVGGSTFTQEILNIGSSTRCLDVPGGSKNSETKLQLWDCNKTGAQQWSFQPNGSVKYSNSNLCLDVPGGQNYNGNRVQIFTCNDTEAQHWYRISDQTIRTPAGKCLDAANVGKSNGTEIIIWDCNNGSNQQWKF